MSQSDKVDERVGLNAGKPPTDANAAKLDFIGADDPGFQVTWLPNGQVVEGSPTRSFQTVEIVGYEPDLIYRAVQALEKARSKK
jgi:hypothetical protein